MRCLLIILETIFAFALWSMKSTTKSYGMPDMLAWDIKELEYDGLCTHSPLIEMVAGEEDGLSTQQLAQKQVEMEARRTIAEAAAQRKYMDKMMSTEWMRNRKHATSKRSREKRIMAKKHWCETCQQAFASAGALTIHRSRNVHLSKLPGYVKPQKIVKHPAQQAQYNAIKASKKYHCATCNVSFSCASALRDHNNGRNHKLAVARASSSGDA